MTWSDALKGAVGGLVGQAGEQAMPDLIRNVLGSEGLQAVTAKLGEAGFADQVASWLDTNRANLPISPDQIRTALGDAHVQELARSLGIPIDAILSALAQHLPQAVGASGPDAAAPSN